MKLSKLVLCTILLLTGSALHATGSAEDRERALESLLAEAGSAQARGDFATAADAYRKSVAINPSIPELWANLGLMYHQLGKRDEAIGSFKKAIHLKSSLFVPQLFLGIEYLAAQDPGGALAFLKNAVKLNPKDEQAALSLGRAYSMLDRGSQAAEAYWVATQLAPNNGSAWLSLGTAYLQQVENDARLMTSNYKELPYVKLRAAETFAEQGKLIEAESAFRAATSATEPAPCAHAEFGITLLRQKKLADAQRQFQLEKQSPTPCGLMRLGIGVAAMAQGRIDSGLNQLSLVDAKDRGFVRSNLPLFREILSRDQIHTLADAIRASQRSGKLFAEFGEIVNGALLSNDVPTIEIGGESAPANAPQAVSADSAVRLLASEQYSVCTSKLQSSRDKLTIAQQKILAFCAFYSGNFRAASVAAGTLIASPATVVQGLYWESKADQNLAVAALTRAGELEPNSPQMWVLIGDIYRQKRRWSEAEADYRKAVALDPTSRSARLSLAIVLFTELKNDDALELDRSLLEAEPDDAEANLLAGEILVQQHEFKEAEPYLQKCGKLSEDVQPRLHVLLGQTYAATDRIPEAIEEYKLALSTDHDGSIHYQLARLYQKTGNTAAASEQIRISKQLREHWDNQAHIALEQRSTDLSRR